MSESDAAASRSHAFDPERILLTVLVSIRAVVVIVAIGVEAFGWSSFRRPAWSVAALAVVVLESAWLVVRWRRVGLVDPVVVGVEAVAGAVAVVGCGVGIGVADRLTALNWGNVFAIVGVTPAVAVASRRLLPAAAVTAGLIAVTEALGRSSGQAVDRVTTGVYFVGLFGAARYIQHQVRAWGAVERRLVSERQAAEWDLAVEQERNRQHRLLHDTALQVLEAIGSGVTVDDAVRARCRRDAVRLRRAIGGEDVEAGKRLLDALVEVVEEAAETGLTVEFTEIPIERDPDERTIDALVWAAREAVRNVQRHAGVTSLVLHVGHRDGGVQVVVRDRGVGFDPEERRGYGLTHSIAERMREVGGRGEVWSAPGRGTRVTLWAPGSPDGPER